MSNVLDSINALLKQSGKEDNVLAQQPDGTEPAPADPGDGQPKPNPQDVVAQSLAAMAAAQQPIDVTPPSTGPLVSSDPSLIDNPMQLQLGAISQPGNLPFFPDINQYYANSLSQGIPTEDLNRYLETQGLQTLSQEHLHQLMMQPPGIQVVTFPPHLAASFPGMEASYGHPSQDEGPKRAKKATRRGPMDEMRQLIRILIKIFPQSVKNLGHDQEAGGGNRISEDQIKNYIKTTLGEGGDDEAPVPEWGVPQGWGEYLAELFAWGTGKEITADQARRCAKREPGRSWESVKSELDDMGVHPDCWPLPLKQHEVRAAEENPVPVKVPRFAPPPASVGGGAANVGAVGEGAAATGVPGSVGKRTAATVGGGTTNGTGVVATVASMNKRYKTAHDKDYRKMNEIEIWEHLVDVVEHIKRKANTHVDMHRVARARDLGMQSLHSLPYWSQLYPGMDLAGGGGAGDAAAGGGMFPHQLSMEVMQAMGMLPPGALPFGGSALKKEEAEGDASGDNNITATKQTGKSFKARGDLFGALGGSDGTAPNPTTLQTLAAQGYGATTMHPDMFKNFMVQQQQAAAAAAAIGGDQQQEQQQREEKGGGEKAFQPNLGKLQ
jgi:hypothetical protein